ncbi:MAG: hypothetical protein ACI9FW_000403 [Flavobacterium sp.]|jgi:hypothetical protein
MKNNSLFFALIIIFSLSSCSPNDKEEIDFSNLTNREWKRTNYNLPTPFDFNLDGNSSINMLDEFNCLADEYFILSDDKKVNYYSSYFLVTISSQDNSEVYSCSDVGAFLSSTGTFEMIDVNTIQLNLKSFDGISNPEYSIQFKIIGDKLTRIETINHPTSYNTITHKYQKEFVQIEQIFEY